MRVKKLQESDRRGGKEVLSRQGKIFRWTVSILLIIYTSIAIFVTVVTLMDSVKTRSDLLKSFIAIPTSITFEAYKKVLFENDFIRYFGNSLILTVGGTVGCIILSAMMAYGIARYEFKGKKSAVQLSVAWHDGSGAGDNPSGVPDAEKDGSPE